MMARVIAPSRLHFGLFHVPVPGLSHDHDTPLRKFGGLGLMLDSPGITVEVCRAEQSHFAGNLAERAKGFYRHLSSTWPELGDCSIRANGPTQHTGLGVGTALGLAMARAMLALKHPEHRPSPQELARAAQRGQRSGIGVHGFELGGWIADDGKLDEDETPRLLQHTPFPGEWLVLLIRPGWQSHWHGVRERSAFSRERSHTAAIATTKALRVLATDTILPAIQKHDFGTFADAIHEYNRRAGEPFFDDQGGSYADHSIEQIIRTVRSWGVLGVGQSSWGPTVFAFADNPASAQELCDRARRQWGSDLQFHITQASATGARLELLENADPSDQDDIRSQDS